MGLAQEDAPTRSATGLTIEMVELSDTNHEVDGAGKIVEQSNTDDEEGGPGAAVASNDKDRGEPALAANNRHLIASVNVTK